MNRILLLTVLLISCTAAASTLSQQTLIKGRSTTLPVDYEIGDVAITDQSICDYQVKEGRREIYLNPKKEGRATLTMWDSSGNKQDVVPLNILKVGLDEILEDARDTFGGSGKLDFSIDRGQVLIKGEVFEPFEMSRLNTFAAQFPQVRNEAVLASASVENISGEIEKAIATPGIKILSIKGRLVLEGTAYSAESAARAEKIAKLYDEGILNLVRIKESKRDPIKDRLIELDVKFMEIKKSALRQFGINWAPGSTPSSSSSNASVGGGGSSGALGGLGEFATSLIGFAFNLAPKIKFARQSGDARVLENPSFLVKSGEVADFFSGTQVPYYSQQAVTFKDVGIKIQAEPIASDEDVDLKINVTVTSPTAGGVNKGIDTNTISTTAYCKMGSSLALGGIFRNQDAKMYNRVPDDVNTSSALFTLFLSKDFISNRSEFVIFVTPRLVDAPDAGANSTTISMSDWGKINEDIMKKRSKKELKKHKAVESKQPAFELPVSLKQ